MVKKKLSKWDLDNDCIKDILKDLVHIDEHIYYLNGHHIANGTSLIEISNIPVGSKVQIDLSTYRDKILIYFDDHAYELKFGLKVKGSLFY